jgi:hypothetical protein
MSSVIFGYSDGPSASATNFTIIGSSNTAVSWTTPESAAALPMPVTSTLSNLYVSLQVAPGTGKSLAFTVMKNGSPTSLTVTISDTSTTATDVINTASFTAADTISLKCVPTGTPTVSGRVAWNMQSSATGQPMFVNTQSSTTAATFGPIIGYGASTTESREVGIMPTGGTLSKLYVTVTAAPGVGNSKIFALRNGGVSQALTATISDANTSSNDTSNSATVAAGDRLAIQISVSGAPTTSTAKYSLLFTPTNPTEFVTVFGIDLTPSTSVTNFAPPISIGSNWDTTESTKYFIPGNYTMKKFYARTATASGAGNAYTFTIRNNAADSLLTTTCTNTTTIQSVTQDVVTNQGDVVTVSCVPSGTPTASRMNLGLLFDSPPAPVTGAAVSTFLMMGV